METQDVNNASIQKLACYACVLKFAQNIDEITSGEFDFLSVVP